MTYCTYKWNELHGIYLNIEDNIVKTSVALAYNLQHVSSDHDICSLLERALKDHGVKIPEKPIMDGAEEYDDIIAAQDLIERG